MSNTIAGNNPFATSTLLSEADRNGDLNVRRMYTLLLATAAGAGIALAVVVVACLVKTYRDRKRSLQRDYSSGFPAALPQASATSRLTTPDIGTFVEPAPALRTTLQPIASWTDMARAILALEPALLGGGGGKAYAPFRKACSPRKEGGGTGAGASCSAPATSSAVPSPPSGTGNTRGECPELRGHLSGLLSQFGGQAELVGADRGPDAGGDGLFGPEHDDGFREELSALQPGRLHKAAVAQCGLRMLALAELGRNPDTALAPPPWTLEYFELKLRIGAARSGRRASGAARSPRAGVSTSTSGVRSVSGSDASDAETEPGAAAGKSPRADPECSHSAALGSVGSGSSLPQRGCGRGSGLAAESSGEESAEQTLGPVRHPEDCEIELAASTPGTAEPEAAQRRQREQPPARSGAGPWALPRFSPGRALRSGGRLRARRGSQLRRCRMEDIARSCWERRELVLRSGSSVGEAQLGVLQGHKVHIYTFKPHVKRQLMRLCELLERAPHPAVACPIALCSTKGKEAAIVPASEACSLEDALGGTEPSQRGMDTVNCPFGRPLPWQARLSIAYDAVMGLLHLHTHHREALLHGSVHMTTVWVGPALHGCLGYPGFLPASLTPLGKGIEDATPAQLRGPRLPLPGVMPLVVDSAYLDPQYHKRGQFTAPADVYALGVVLLKLLTGLPSKGIVTIAKEAFRQELLQDVLDPLAGEWPPAVANGLMEIALTCCERRHTRRTRLEADLVYQIQGLMIDIFRTSLFQHSLIPTLDLSRDGELPV